LFVGLKQTTKIEASQISPLQGLCIVDLEFAVSKNKELLSLKSFKSFLDMKR